MSSSVAKAPESSFSARLRAVRPELTKSEAAIAQWLILNEGTIGLETGASIAAKTGVSPITVSRFFRRLGYKGLPALKTDLQASAANLHLDAVGRTLRLLEGEIGTLIKRDAEAVLGLGSQIARPEWTDAVLALEGASDVFVTGFQTVRGLAEDFARRLSIVRPSVRFVSPHDTGLAEWIHPPGHAPRNCLLLVDTIPYARQAEPIVQMARQAGMSAVVVTDELNTWAARHTPLVFFAPTKVGTFLESTGPLATLLNLITHSVAGRDPERTRERLDRWPEVLRNLDLF
ncbi:MurR/RpiR family transcriptional regulator [Rubellimicrobium roseum]|uniref:MurR/RpiR family transcriptional regulator n=1 Tax=Rubellimicrobium roseum TaxID=687525 RepID=A0A5C4N722_9RHOB|nr:MurR/RpiR family transcriptional regulator [Rubellimicrobium roseum]TNC67521.1 MurR/RpiR family transcriptional regulator [Rubellimicrobium roseum]